MKFKWALFIRPREPRVPCDRKRGFTLIEVCLASSIMLLLFLVLFETLIVCNRMAANLKWRLAADSIAFDKVWELFNKQLTEFDAITVKTSNNWEVLSSDKTSVWPNGNAQLYWSIAPCGVPTTNWVINTNVRWKLPSGETAYLPNAYTLVRSKNKRNSFRATN